MPARAPRLLGVPDAVWFVAAVLLHAAASVWLGTAAPSGLQSDANVYLELADNLWRRGEFGSRVTVTYPPLFPLFAAPAMGLPTNAARFAGIQIGQSLALGAACLALLPLARRFSPRPWLLLAPLPLLGGVTHYAPHAQSEALFTALCVLFVGVASQLGPQTLRRWAALGAVCSLAVSTRRIGLVVPATAALVLAQSFWGRWRDARPAALALVGGAALGALPTRS